MHVSTRQICLGVLLVAAAFGFGLASSHFRWGPYRLLVDRGENEVRGALPAPNPVGGGDAEADRRPGLWHLARTEAATGGVDRETIESLADLPYLSGYEEAAEKSGVTLHDVDAAVAGWNLVVSGHAPEAELIDMRGRLLHRWAKPLAEVWPGMAREEDLGGFETFWRRAHLLPGGELLAIWDGIGLVKLDRDSNVVWAHAGREHHDLFVDAAGAIHTLARSELEGHPRLAGPVGDDLLRVLTPDGRPVSEVSVLESFLDSDFASLIPLAKRSEDLLHTNTIELMDGRFAAAHPLYRRGNVLISVPRLNAIAVIDPTARRVVWTLTGLFRFQHQPTMLENGNILIFDNTGGREGASRVLEIDPLTQEIVWRYDGPSDRRFTSYFLGSVQPLAGGNVLVTESTAGRAFEIDRQGALVWEFVNPHRAGEERRLVASLLEVVRLPHGGLEREFLEALGVVRP